MKTIVACVVLVSIAFHVVSATMWEDCDPKIGEVKSVHVSDCPDDVDPCILKKGTMKNISIEFVSKNATKTVKASVHGVIGGVPLPFSLPKPDACAYGGLSCPLEDSKNYTYSHSLEIKDIYPAVEVSVKWELLDDTKQDIVCILISCKIE